MNDDFDSVDLLRRYRPAGPPPDLRARIFASSGTRRAWPWAAAAAALLVIIVGLQIETANLEQASPKDPGREETIAEAVWILGGGPEAHRAAEYAWSQHEMVRALEEARMPPPPFEKR